jgi:glycosyltransferase involved in cell wall biosynthesis
LRAVSSLHVELDAPLPIEIAIGAGTAVFVAGWAFSPGAVVEQLELVVDGERQPLLAFGMPRLDPFAELHPGAEPFALAAAGRDPESDIDPSLHSYASGFWGIARIGPGHADAVSLGLVAELRGGGTAHGELGRVALAEVEPPVSGPEAPVAICMATYNPPPELLRRQLDSIRAQSVRDFVCLISDDCSRPESFAVIQQAVAGDERFVLRRSPRRLGFYRNFERALQMVPGGVEFIALSDQDDFWHPDKLETLLGEIGSAQLIYSDARIVTRDGEQIADTYWSERSNNHSDLLSLFVANAVTGAASLFRRELLDYALPFPPAQFAHYHDHWLGLVARSLGEIEFVQRPLYDYVQHGTASLGHATANEMSGLRVRLARLGTRSVRERMRMWRMHYFVDYARLLQFATIIDMRCRERMSPDKRRVVALILDGDRSPRTAATMLVRGVRELSGRRPETLGAEWMLFCALLWRRAVDRSASPLPRNRRLRLDALPPGDLAPSPERQGAPSVEGAAVRAIAEKVRPLDLTVADDAPPRINLLIPSIDLEHVFAGYIAKYNLARRLAERGNRVRIVTVDPAPPPPRGWQRTLESYSGLERLSELVEFAYGRAAGGVEVSPSDTFIATTWWTAHIAGAALAQLGGERFLYLIQEYEPFTFPMGTFAALATESYALPHTALFSTELLRGYYRAHGLGVYGGPAGLGDRGSRAFQNAITPIASPAASELAARDSRRLLFYARPEPHAARNLFELGVLALSSVAREGRLAGWELHGIGTVGADRWLPLGGGATLKLLPRTGEGEYARVLREHDVGLSLMYTPHPSLVPIEMASAGLLTVTNTFENKTADALAEISPNLIAAEPTVESVAEALAGALAAVSDHERRARGAAVNWSSDWGGSFGDELIEWVEAAVAPRRDA